jgi:2-keto-4-pentenoate hydratase
MRTMDLIQQGIDHFGTAADLARATKYTPQAISIARKRMAAQVAAGKPATISDGLSKAIRRALARPRKQAA